MTGTLRKPEEHGVWPADDTLRRLAIGFTVAVPLIAFSFMFAGTVLTSNLAASAPHSGPLEVTLRPVEPNRVLATPTPKPEPTSTPKPLFTPVPTPRPKSTPRSATTPRPVATPIAAPRPVPAKVAKRVAAPRPEGAHNHLILRRVNPSERPASGDFSALRGGNALAGQPMAQQSGGNSASAPDIPTAPVKPLATPTPVPVPTVAPAARVAEAPKPVPTPVPEAPKPPKVAAGPTRDAEPADQVRPEIPDSLKSSTFKSFVRVKVQVHADGSFDPILRTSSGNQEIDQRVLSALKQWKWKPKLVNGVPQESTELFKFEFENS